MQLKIFWVFFKVGMLGYGGGPASIPLIKAEVVDIHKWMTDDEFQDMLAIGNTLPGPIATKLAGYIGYIKSGWLGLINAVLATIIPTIFLMIILLTLFVEFKDLGWVQDEPGVLPVVGVMMALLTIDFLSKAKAKTTWIFLIPFTLVSLVLLVPLSVHPAIIIAVIIIFSLLRREGRKT